MKIKYLIASALIIVVVAGLPSSLALADDVSLAAVGGQGKAGLAVSASSVGTVATTATAKTGWASSHGDRRYYVKGVAQTGLKRIAGKTYYFDKDGVMQTGFQKISGKWRYFNKKGVMQTGLKKINGYKYYFNAWNGVMRTNSFKTVRGKKFYFTDNGTMANIGYYKKYLIAYNGVCYKVNLKKTGDRDADARRVAKLIAKCCGPKGTQKDIDYVGRATYYVSNFCAKARYTTEGSVYSTAYGVFIAKQFSCAGSTRALGLVLDYLGYSWTHVNPNQWTHQWCRLKLDGRTGYADAAYLPTGTVGYGKNSPLYR